MNRISELVKLKKPLVLASKSPRRKYLLDMLGFEFEIIPADIDEESVSDGLPPAEYVERLAEEKAKAVGSELDSDAVVIGSDTIVVLDGKIINKPADDEDAVRMLKTLSGRIHTVYTGIALYDSPSGDLVSNYQETRVRFRELEEDEIRAYVAGGSPTDKAGAYGIQDDFGAVFVDRIEGCYYNVVGLPVELLYVEMRKFCGR